MKSIARLFVRPLLMLVAVAYSGIAPATYVFNSIDYPGSTFTDVRGINNVGQIVGYAAIGGTSFGFVYTDGVFALLPPAPGGLPTFAHGINDSGVVVGGTFDDLTPHQAFILADTYFLFSEPGWAITTARAISLAGVLTGVSINSDASGARTLNAFIYNPSTNVFTDIFVPNMNPLGLNVAQGMNAAGQVVGSVGIFGHGATGFLRQPDGSISTFQINNNSTGARGINDFGVITGFTTLAGGRSMAFVGTSAGYELLNIPGAVESAGQGINNAGQIVGLWFDAAENVHGFIATPASLPTGTTTGGAYTFSVSVVPNVTIFIDPAVSLGFDYEIGAGDPKFASVQLPIGIGDNRYTLIVHGKAFALAGGESFDFAAHGFANGVAQFRVVDIEASAELDPNNAAAFPTGLRFTVAGMFTGTMTPLCSSKSAPANARGRGLSPCLSQ